MPTNCAHTIWKSLLWVFVGSSVNAVRSVNRQSQSDVLTVVNFLHRFLHEPTWAKQSIDELVEGKSGLHDEAGHDIFVNKFGYLRGCDSSGAEFYTDILKTILNAHVSSALHLCDIRGSDGEIGLKAGGAEDYFGVVYIGDTSAFKRLVQNNAPSIVVEDDEFSDSLFDSINEPDTTVDMLIGSRKFIEGWKLLARVQHGVAKHRYKRRFADNSAFRARCAPTRARHVPKAKFRDTRQTSSPHKAAGDAEHIRCPRQLHVAVPQLLGTRGHSNR